MKQVISILHEISNDENGLIGSLVTSISNEIIFIWKSYKNDKEKENSKNFIQIPISKIQKIIIAKNDDVYHLSFVALNSSDNYRFYCSKDFSFQLIMFVQMLSLNLRVPFSNISASELSDYVTNSYQNPFDFLEMDVENKIINIPLSHKFNYKDATATYSLTKYKINGDDFMNNPVTLDEFNAVKSFKDLRNEVRKRGVAPEARKEVWPVVFGVLPFDKTKREEVKKLRIKEYQTLRKQWQTRKPVQFKTNYSLKESFSTIIVDVNRTKVPNVFPKNVDVRQVLISLLKTFCIFNFDMRYTQGMNDYGLSILSIFLSDDSDVEEAEVLAFWCFVRFVETSSLNFSHIDMRSMQIEQLSRVLAIVDEFCPECSEWIKEMKLNDLTFLIGPFMLSYSRTFNMESVQRIWETIICCPCDTFLPYFTAALIILGYPMFKRIASEDGNKVFSLAEDIVKAQNVGAAIGVALEIMGKIYDFDLFRCKEVFEGDALYSPNKEFIDILKQDKNLIY